MYKNQIEQQIRPSNWLNWRHGNKFSMHKSTLLRGMVNRVTSW